MQEYMRGTFLVMYAGPLATISYLYVKVSRELQTNSSIIMFETRHRESRIDSHSTTTDIRGSRDCDGMSEFSRGSYRESRARHEHCDSELDIPKEKRTQKYLVTIVTVYAICLGPLMVLRLARLALLETYDNSGHFDITYTMFVWVAFLPTCTTPLLFAAWQMSRPAKERLRGYFRFSNRKLRQSCETVVTSGGTPATARGRASEYGERHIEENPPDNTLYQPDFS